MKKILFLIAVSLSVVLTSCKNNEENKEASENDPKITEQTDEFKMYPGEFIYMKSDNAAVLKGRNFIYGVVIDDMAMELAEQVNAVKKDSLDMVPVVVKGVVMKNPKVQKEGDGWAEVITLKEIIAVSDKPAEADIKIEETTN